jgi:MoaA/NifB/PqqE/SkfB family radical SAM enzyme
MNAVDGWSLSIPRYVLREQTEAYEQDLALSFAKDEPLVQPLFGVIVLSRFCDSACIYCPYHRQTFKFNTSAMSTTDARRCIDQFADFGLKRLQLSGGEPLMHPDLPELIAYGRSRGLGVNIVTAGTRLTREVAEALLDSGLEGLVVSIDALDPAIYEHQRGCSASLLGPALEVLDWMQLQRSDLWIGVNCVVTRHNVRHVPELARCIDVQGFWTQVQLVHSFTPERENQALMPDAAQVRETVEALLAMKQNGRRINHSEHYLYGMIHWAAEGHVPSEFRCPMGYLQVLVDVDCQVRLCCMLPPGGSLQSNDLTGLWESSTFQRQRRAIRQQSCPQCWLMLVDLWK